jgi:hypothetical protein
MLNCLSYIALRVQQKLFQLSDEFFSNFQLPFARQFFPSSSLRQRSSGNKLRAREQSSLPAESVAPCLQQVNR